MKQLWYAMVSKFWKSLDNALLGLTYVQETGMLPVETYNFFAVSQLRDEEARLLLGVTRLKEDV